MFLNVQPVSNYPEQIEHNKEVADALYLLQNGTGTALSAQDSWTLAKHLKTLPVRFNQSVSNAQKYF